jgi:hypothetical protein
MTSTAAHWTTTRKAWARPCIAALLALAAAQVALSFGPAVWRLAGGLAYVMACLGAAWTVLERAELVRNRSPLIWKILTWAVPAVSGFAMVGHLLFGSKLEQALLGGGCGLVAVTSLFIAFSPDDADMVDNDQMTRPSEP